MRTLSLIPAAYLLLCLAGCSGDAAKPAADSAPPIANNSFMTPAQKQKALADEAADKMNMEIRQGKIPVPTSAATAPGSGKTGP